MFKRPFSRCMLLDPVPHDSKIGVCVAGLPCIRGQIDLTQNSGALSVLTSVRQTIRIKLNSVHSNVPEASTFFLWRIGSCAPLYFWELGVWLSWLLKMQYQALSWTVGFQMPELAKEHNCQLAKEGMKQSYPPGLYGQASWLQRPWMPCHSMG